jgi:hypothetical protein
VWDLVGTDEAISDCVGQLVMAYYVWFQDSAPSANLVQLMIDEIRECDVNYENCKKGVDTKVFEHGGYLLTHWSAESLERRGQPFNGHGVVAIEHPDRQKLVDVFVFCNSLIGAVDNWFELFENAILIVSD